MVRQRLGDLLVTSNLITEEQLMQALANKNADEKLGDALLREGDITEQQLIEVLEFQLGIPHINLSQFAMEQEAVQLVPRELARRHIVMPIRTEDHKLYVAMADPMDYFAMEELRMATGYQITPAIATKDDIFQSITKYYDLQESLADVMDDMGEEEQIDDAGIADEDSPIVRLVNQIIANGVGQRASDIHFDPQETELRIRYRIDGVLRTERSLPKHMQNVITARVKIMSHLNITEQRLPQDGRMKLTIDFKSVDIRVSTLPSMYGEKVVMRILDRSHAFDDLHKLGFAQVNLQSFKQVIERPNGIVLITGPTGAGKSSTLYAALHHLNKDEVNIITIEDPVEYHLDGVNQVQVKEQIGMTFAQGLRSILRQDPDIVMVGEIRDLETAEIAIRASLTGHLVLSTLHTNSAIAALTRLMDMGIESFLISSSLSGVVGQRLVRKVCRDCQVEEQPTERERAIFKQRHLPISTVVRGRGCASCGMTGYRGRIAIHEVVVIDDKLRTYMMNSESATIIRKHLESIGMSFLLDDGLKKVSQGLTTTEEVLRVTAIE
ncbi:GspE/PulE family protein [Virgibacillus dokdonensis]|uniref:GspE/PulE family protein n=1 Tax=Virgibacillus dokdonensis TaxID=302167 RepID=UPI00098AA024|nr:ATPase, T2SS/T4P/T4SS family [Virgibacillus dokdonensis]